MALNNINKIQCFGKPEPNTIGGGGYTKQGAAEGEQPRTIQRQEAEAIQDSPEQYRGAKQGYTKQRAAEGRHLKTI
jgi:hypothetical protein